jgi:hypothetical protein
VRLVRVLSNLKGMYPLHSDNFLTGFPSRFWCSFLLCHLNIRKVFLRLCLLLNALNGVLRARNACSFKEIFDRNCFELPLSGQQCLQVIRGWASVPRIASSGPAVPSSYLRLGFGPSNCLFRASSAFRLFKVGLRFLELPLSGQQCLQVIRGQALIPRVVFFGPAMPSKCPSSSCGPLNHPFRACSATMLFGYRCLNPRNTSLGC